MQEWQTIKLIRLAEFINGYGFKPADWSKEGLPIVRIEQIKNPDSQYDFYNGILPSYNIIEDGDLIFSWSASLFLKIWDRGKAALNQHLFKVVPNVNTDKLFLKYLIEHNLPALLISAHGSTMQHITRKELEKFDVNIPIEKSEQIQIAAIINNADKAIEQTETRIAKYQRIKTGLMQDLLTKGIDIKGNIRNKSTHRFVVKKGFEVPEDWEVDCLNSYCNLHNNLRKPISAIERFNQKGSYPYYGATGIIDFLNQFRINGKFVLIGEDGDHFLKFETQEMTHLVEGKFNVSNHAHILSGKNGCMTEWIHHFFSHRDITFYLTRQGAGRFKLNKQSLINLPICVPSEKEQIRIVDFIKSFNQQFNGEKLTLSKLHSIKIGLMQDLLSGKVRVN